MRDHRAKYFPCVKHHHRVQDTTTTTTTPPQEPPAWGPDRDTTGWSQQRDWEQDRERLNHLQKRAGETVRRPPLYAALGSPSIP